MGIRPDPTNPGTFVVSFGKRHPITRQPVTLRRKGLKTKSEARRTYSEMVVEVEDKLRRTIVPKWPRLVGDFISSCRNRGLTEKTIENYSLCLKAHTFDDWAERLSDTITTQEIRDLIRNKVGHRSTSQQKNLLKYIRGAFTYGVETSIIPRNPVPMMQFRHGDKIKKTLTETQVRVFLNKAKELDWEWYPIWVTAIYTGMRSGELYALTWDKVNLDGRHIVVDCSWNSKDGFKSTKSGDDRILEIAPNLLPILRELKLQSFDSSFVLPRIDKWDKGQQAEDLRKFLRGINLPEIRFHDLRATWATLLLSKGVDPIRVMKAGGWKDIKTMMIYVRKAGVDIKGMTDTLDLHDPSRETGKVLKLGLCSDPL